MMVPVLCVGMFFFCEIIYSSKLYSPWKCSGSLGSFNAAETFFWSALNSEVMFCVRS